MRSLTKLYVHCADTPEGVWFDKDDIYKWHVEENGWSDIGYHYIILLDGTVQTGRPLNRVGAGVKGHNRGSVHVCYIGGMDNIDTRTPQQKQALKNIILTLRSIYGDLEVLGHRDTNPKKYCPSFDAKDEYRI